MNRRIARWFLFLQDYNFILRHVPGKQHAAPDMLSRPPGADKGIVDNQDITVIPPEAFIQLTWDRSDGAVALDDQLAIQQKIHQKWICDLPSREAIQSMSSLTTSHHLAYRMNDGWQVVVPPDDALKRQILAYHHDDVTSGHLGRDQTYNSVSNRFWWPGMRAWIAQYVKGCAACQQNKTSTHPQRTALYRIPVPPDAHPFQIVAMDLITQLPRCNQYDTILTIVDHGCSRAAIFIPCSTTITGEGIARLYFEHVYRWFGLPSKLISDRDPRFTSHFGRALCQQLGVQQNLSTAFHPQTDGLSERKNAWVEQYLRFLTSHQQNDWAHWLPIATAVHNRAVNATTKVAPIEAILGYKPRLSYHHPTETPNQTIEERKQTAFEKQQMAKEALNRMAHSTPIAQYRVDDKVWLEGKNLSLPYQTLKLAPK
jgi:hypothetical protein